MDLADGDYWIDDYGAWNHVALGDPCPFFTHPGLRNSERMDLAFRHLGMVRVSKRRGTVTVQWDIAEACDESLDSACAFLWEMPGVGQMELRFYFGGWTYEIFNSVRDALIRLEILRSYRNVTPYPRARTIPLGKEADSTCATAVVGRARYLLSRNGGRFDSDLCNRLAEEKLMERILLFREEDGGSWLSYRYIGQRSLFSQVFGTEISDDLIGKHYAFDPATNQRTCTLSRTYPHVLSEWSEHIDQVFAPIRYNNEEGYWVSYQRILIPCSGRDGRRMLLLLADTNQESLIAA